ncbi:transmembrane protein 182-like [Heterodontus francisci]|uniref:transmembrane protein 182-like n=1 Tax=Heterodontus francisci TaxID=7792 RepID=UPI00355B830B
MSRNPRRAVTDQWKRRATAGLGKDPSGYYHFSLGAKTEWRPSSVFFNTLESHENFKVKSSSRRQITYRPFPNPETAGGTQQSSQHQWEEHEAQIGAKVKPTPRLDQISNLPWSQSEHEEPLEGHIQRRSIAETMKKIKHFPGTYNLFNRASAKTFHYEGFFWSCAMTVRRAEDSFSTYVFFDQALSKSCIGAYQLPFPTRLNRNSSAYNSATGFRHSWSVLIVLSVFTIGIGFGLIVYEAFQERDSLYILGGGLFVLAGILSTFSIIMYTYWIQALVAVVDQIIEPNKSCPDPKLKVQFGWSFMTAPVSIFFSLFAGLLFFQVGHAARNKKKNIAYSLAIDKVGDEEL